MEIVQSIEGLFEVVCVNLFESLNCTVRRIESAQNEIMDAPIACIDAGSSGLELMTGLQLPMSVLALTYPGEGDIGTVGEAHLEDWIGELSNQLIGRLKIELSDHDCQVILGLPTTCYGHDVSPLSDICYKRALYFELDGEVCVCYIAVEAFADNMVFSVKEDRAAGELLRGELEMF